MEIRLYATLRPIVGRSKVILDTKAGDTVRSMLDELVTRWPDLKPKIFLKNEELHPSIHVFLNGRDIRYLGGLDIPIPAETEICIFPPVGGGQ
ncbi:MAG: ubiquitin-like small modifier protein 1 [Caldilineaceae bacterium]